MALWGLLAARQAFFAAWLAAFYFWISVPLGALALLLIHDLTGGRWERVAREPLEAAAATVPVFILLFLPIATNMPSIYIWARSDSTVDFANRWYLNGEFFGARAVAYFTIWCGFAAMKLGWPRAALPEWLAAIGGILLGLSASFAAIDWIMSIEPRWFSSDLCDACLFRPVYCLARHGARADRLRRPTRWHGRGAYRDDLAALATVLLAVVIFGLMPVSASTSSCGRKISRRRSAGISNGFAVAGQYLIYGGAVGQFLVPFAALVTTPAKRSRVLVGAVACLLLLAELVQVWWLVLPPFNAIGILGLAFAVAVFMGGLWAVLFLVALRYGEALPFRAARVERLRHG